MVTLTPRTEAPAGQRTEAREASPVLGEIVVVVGGQRLGFVTNDRGVIDATSRYDTARYMAGGPSAWRLAGAPVVRAIILHHWAGWYGPPLGTDATPAQELAQLDAMAADHRDRFGLGPAYNIVPFPSGRVWAVGKHGTHRVHTKGRNPVSRVEWNVDGRAVAVPGDYEIEGVSRELGQAIRRAVDEVSSWPGVAPDRAIHEHGIIPTVNSAGVRFSQGTASPGRNLAAWRAAGGLAGEMEPDRYGDGYVDGYRAGVGLGAMEAAKLYRDHHNTAEAAVAEIIKHPPAPPVVRADSGQRRAS
jgi:hypothetical protein